MVSALRVFFFKQKTAYEMRISDWSSDVCSSDLAGTGDTFGAVVGKAKLVQGDAPRIEGLQIIWKQDPKVPGRGHFSHRLAFSPEDRKSVVQGKSVSVRVDLGGRRIIKKQNTQPATRQKYLAIQQHKKKEY